MSLQEELAALIAAEEKRLGVGSESFMKRHQEIMDQIDELMTEGGQKNAKTVCDGQRGG